jgi:23S rRNA pseudouridine2604 synthase
MKDPLYPMRINRYLALKNYASRRQADSLIQSGYVTINGKRAVLGDKVNEGDTVLVNEKVMQKKAESRIYIAYHKPVGIVSHSPEEGQRGIEEIFGYKTRLFPIGRLDQDSHGLIILTNDGRITKKMLEPKYGHEREYVVTVDRSLSHDAVRQMAGGVNIGDYTTKKCFAEKIGPKTFRIILTEGKKRQIRRMCEAVGYQVVDLCRTRIMDITLGDLAEGEHRQLKGDELRNFLKELL